MKGKVASGRLTTMLGLACEYSIWWGVNLWWGEAPSEKFQEFQICPRQKNWNIPIPNGGSRKFGLTPEGTVSSFVCSPYRANSGIVGSGHFGETSLCLHRVIVMLKLWYSVLIEYHLGVIVSDFLEFNLLLIWSYRSTQEGNPGTLRFLIVLVWDVYGSNPNKIKWWYNGTSWLQVSVPLLSLCVESLACEGPSAERRIGIQDCILQ